MLAKMESYEKWEMFWKTAKAVVGPKGEWSKVLPGTAGWLAWERYFAEFLGEVPQFMRTCAKRGCSASLPAMTPQQFETGWQDPGFRKAIPQSPRLFVDKPPGRWAKVKIPLGNPFYEAAKDFACTSKDDSQWKIDDNENIWISYQVALAMGIKPEGKVNVRPR